MAYAGNLWSMDAAVKSRASLHSFRKLPMTVQGGILDPLSGESPYSAYSNYSLYDQYPAGWGILASAGVCCAHRMVDAFIRTTATIGAGGYFSRQNWGFGRYVNGWSGTVDWNVPFGKGFQLGAAKFYRGQALGGLGGGLYRSALFSGMPLTNPASNVQGTRYSRRMVAAEIQAAI